MALTGSGYSPIVIEHFQNPRNVGELPDANAQASVTNPVCGDLLQLMLKIDAGRIVEVRFKTFGCEAAIAASSLLTEMIKGKTLSEVQDLTPDMITAALGGLPRVKLHASALAEQALKDALEAYGASHA
ncbi:MAG TPA: iron-sulfur cluster assembly scaffold protein [Alphaproteobacteria bacterium]|nr:iron-sulfur cluster assembly scaffold protein [Alphaproteobacteria bacterium]